MGLLQEVGGGGQARQGGGGGGHHLHGRPHQGVLAQHLLEERQLGLGRAGTLGLKLFSFGCDGEGGGEAHRDLGLDLGGPPGPLAV